MVIDDDPTITILGVSKTVARRQAIRLAVFNPREGVIAGVDRRIAIDADQLFAEVYRDAGHSLSNADEILAHGRPARTYFRCRPYPRAPRRPHRGMTLFRDRQRLVPTLRLPQQLPPWVRPMHWKQAKTIRCPARARNLQLPIMFACAILRSDETYFSHLRCE